MRIELAVSEGEVAEAAKEESAETKEKHEIQDKVKKISQEPAIFAPRTTQGEANREIVELLHPQLDGP